MKEKACIIGGGLGGLFTGAMLAKEGLHVEVLEKNRTIGGGLQNFVRDGEVFDTGMHILGGLRTGGALHKICHYLGILDSMKVRHVDDDCMDSLFYEQHGKEYCIASGREGFIESLAGYFPHERENLRRYVQAVYAVTEELDLFYLRQGEDGNVSHSTQFIDSADHFIASYTDDARLRSMLAYMNPLYGGMAGHTPAYIHCLINALYINGPSRFVGGSQQMATALRRVIEEHGGAVHAGRKVTHIEVADRRVGHVETQDGERHTADWYVSAIHPCTMFPMLSDGALPRSYRNRLNSIPNTYSAFKVFLKLKPGSFPYINHTCYCQNTYSDVWKFHDTDDSLWPNGFMYMTPPVERPAEDAPPPANNASQPTEFATKILITSPMSFEMVRRWEDTVPGQRGEDYEAWKQEHAERLVARLERRHPGIREAIEKTYAASPLTIRDHYGVKDGSMYGFRQDCQNMLLSQVPPVTKVRNLLLTGQNINLHGICGVPLTAISTAEVILGKGHMTDKINEHYNNTHCYGKD